MTTRSRRETITFAHPFRIKSIDRSLQAGAYEVIADEGIVVRGVPSGRHDGRGSRGTPAQFDDGDGFHRVGRPVPRAARRRVHAS
jgi:hypothetical protein